MDNQDIEIIYKNIENNFQIISPLTFEDAKLVSDGTDWFKNKNSLSFDMYNEYAPIFILTMPDTNKLFFWKYEKDNVFMNKNCDIIDIDYIEQNWAILEPIIMWLKSLLYIPENYKTHDLCFDFVQQNGMSLKYVPEEFKTKHMCLEAIKQNKNAFQYIPDRYKTFDFYINTIKTDIILYNLFLKNLKIIISIYNVFNMMEKY